MISILPQQSSEGVFAFSAQDGEQSFGSVTYQIEGQQMRLLTLQAPLFSVRDGLLRAAMHAALRQGCVQCICTEPSLFEMLQKEKFTAEQDGFSVLLEVFFARRCKE